MKSSKIEVVELVYNQDFFNDLAWLKKHNKRLFYKVKELCADIALHPFTGKGKPEPLKYQFPGCWSRRIDKNNRLVYKPCNNYVLCVQCRKHYK